MPDPLRAHHSLSIIHPDPAIRESLAASLRFLQYPIRGFASTGAAQQAMGPGVHGLLLVDLDVMGLDGFQIYSDLVSQGRLLAVLFQTERTDFISSRSPRGTGATDLMKKPTSAAHLSHQVDVLFGVTDRWHHLIHNGRCLDDRIREISSIDQETLRLVFDGLPNKAMASHLFISVRGVELRRQRMLRRLEVPDVAELLERTIAQRVLAEIRALRRRWTELSSRR